MIYRGKQEMLQTSVTKFKFPCIIMTPAAPRKNSLVTYLSIPMGYQHFLGYRHIRSPNPGVALDCSDFFAELYRYIPEYGVSASGALSYS